MSETQCRGGYGSQNEMWIFFIVLIVFFCLCNSGSGGGFFGKW